MEVLQDFRRQGRGRGSMAQDHSSGARKQGQNPQHPERFVFSCDAVGVGTKQSNRQCTPERETSTDARRSHTAGDNGSSRAVARAASHGGRDRCIYWVASGRADRSSVAGREFRAPGHSRTALRRHDGPRLAENRGLCKGRAVGLGSCGIFAEAETVQSVQPTFGLGFRFGNDEWQATLLARDAMATTWETGGRKGGHIEACWISYVPSYLHNSPNAKQRGCEGRAGASSSCQQPGYARSVRASRNAKEAVGAEQVSENGVESGQSSGLTGPYWTMAGIFHSLQVLEKNGGDDETRTRDLCRDRAAF
jgi:hypothetical protein